MWVAHLALTPRDGLGSILGVQVACPVCNPLKGNGLDSSARKSQAGQAQEPAGAELGSRVSRAVSRQEEGDKWQRLAVPVTYHMVRRREQWPQETGMGDHF